MSTLSFLTCGLIALSEEYVFSFMKPNDKNTVCSKTTAGGRCQGIAAKAGRRCNNYPKQGSLYCRSHDPKRHICQGITRNGVQCKALAITKYSNMYCRADHDPRLPTSTATTELRLPRLRNEKGQAVREYRKGKDVYQNTILASSSAAVAKEDLDHLDHVLELHIIRDALDKVKKHGIKFEAHKQKLIWDVREAANSKENLNFTLKDINLSKYHVFSRFQEDYRNGNHHENGIVPYLQDASNTKLTRSISQRIQNELINSKEFVIDELYEEKGLNAQIIKHLNDNLTAMKLY